MPFTPPFAGAGATVGAGGGLQYGSYPSPASTSIATTTPGSTGGPIPYPGPLDSSSLQQQAFQQAELAYGPARDQIRQQQAEEAARLQAQTQAISQLYGQLADIQKSVAPETQQIYSTAAKDQSAFGQGYSDGLSSALNKSGSTINQTLGLIGAPSGQFQSSAPNTAAANVLGNIGGVMPATVLNTSGAAFARADALLPGATYGAGLNEVLYQTQQSNATQAKLNDQLNQLISQEPAQVQSILSDLKDQQLKLQQFGFEQQQYTDKLKQDNEAKAVTLFNAGLLSQRALGRILGAPGWRKLPDTPKDSGTSGPSKIDVAVSKLVGYLADSSGQPIVKDKKGNPVPITVAAGSVRTSIARDGAGNTYLMQTTADGKITVQPFGQGKPLPGVKPLAAPKIVKDGAGNSYQWDPGTSSYVPFGQGKPAAAAKAVSPKVLTQARQTLASAEQPYWALQSDSHTALTLPQVQSLISAHNKATGDTLTLADLTSAKDGAANQDKLGLGQFKLVGRGTSRGADITALYLKLVQVGVPGRRAFQMVGAKYPDWRASHQDWYSGKGSAAQAAAAGFDYPLGTAGKVIGQPYQGSHTLYGNWQSDNAIDIAVPVGTPVYAVADGVIGSRIGPFQSQDPHLTGNRLTIQANGNAFYYAHLSRLNVQPGQRVRKGDLIGYSGAANGVQHLHIASEYGNPFSYFGGGPTGGRTLTASTSSASAKTAEGAQAAAARLAWRTFKWGQDQMSALTQLWQGESSWNYTARNPKSGALGIPQALGHKLPPGYANDPVTQIKWGLRYIKQRYGTPQAALAFKQRNGWY